MASLLYDRWNSWGHRLPRRLFGRQCKNRCVSLRLLWCLSPDTSLLERDREAGGWGEKARLAVKQQSDAVTPTKPRLLCRGENQSRNHPLCGVESSKDRAVEQRTPPLAGNKAELGDTDKKSQKCVTLVRNFSFDIIASSHEQIYA